MVHIVDDQNKKPIAAGPLQKGSNRVKEEEPIGFGLSRRELRRRESALLKFRNENRKPARSRPDDRGDVLAAPFSDERPDDLSPCPVRRCAVCLDTAAPQDACAPGRCQGADLLRESRLTDAGLAADPDEGAMAAPRVLEPTDQQR